MAVPAATKGGPCREHAYSYGMFTYVQELTDSQGNDLEFEVINYWVQ